MKILRVDDKIIRWATLVVLVLLTLLLTTLALLAQTNREEQQDQTLYQLKIQQEKNLGALDKLNYRVQTDAERLATLEQKQTALMQEISRIEGGGAALMFILVVLQFLGIRGRQPRDSGYVMREQLHLQDHHSHKHSHDKER